MSSHTDLSHISILDYLQGERGSDTKHEYVGGQVYAIVGARDRHNIIAGNLFSAIHPHARQRQCQLFMSDMKAYMKATGMDCFYYPDIMLACDPDDRHAYYRERPCMIVEVLSESTERLDRREKFFAYAQIDSLQEYILISQDRKSVEHFRRKNNWAVEFITEGELQFECIELSIGLDVIYAEVDVSGQT